MSDIETNLNSNDYIQSKIDKIISNKNVRKSGVISKVNKYSVEAYGLDDVFYMEKVYIGDGQDNIGYVDKINSDKVSISLLKITKPIKLGDSIVSTGEQLMISFSKDFCGLVVDPFGVDRINNKELKDSYLIPAESPKIPIMDRDIVNRPLNTGIAAIDLMFPIGKGQRQLIIGDKKTGKSQILLDTIANQKGKNMICFYVAIGKTKKEVKKIYYKLIEKGLDKFTVIVASFYDDPTPMLKLTPYAALSMAEEYLKEGRDVLVCIDDLKKHADACKEIALNNEKNTGRESYPADIFYTHSRLLEKGCQHINGGSITILPVMETKGGIITDYISTNIISITDGQIVLSDKMFVKGQKPAIRYGLSVSRLGGAVQTSNMKVIGSTVRRKLLSYLENVDVYQLVDEGSMSDALKFKMAEGKKIMDCLKQNKFSPISEEKVIEKFSFVSNINNEENNIGVENNFDIEISNIDSNDVVSNEMVNIDLANENEVVSSDVQFDSLSDSVNDDVVDNNFNLGVIEDNNKNNNFEPVIISSVDVNDNSIVDVQDENYDQDGNEII